MQELYHPELRSFYHRELGSFHGFPQFSEYLSSNPEVLIEEYDRSWTPSGGEISVLLQGEGFIIKKAPSYTNLHELGLGLAQQQGWVFGSEQLYGESLSDDRRILPYPGTVMTLAHIPVESIQDMSETYLSALYQLAIQTNLQSRADLELHAGIIDRRVPEKLAAVLHNLQEDGIVPFKHRQLAILLATYREVITHSFVRLRELLELESIKQGMLLFDPNSLVAILNDEETFQQYYVK